MDAHDALWTAQGVATDYSRGFTDPNDSWGNFVVPMSVDGEPVPFDPMGQDIEQRQAQAGLIALQLQRTAATAAGVVMNNIDLAAVRDRGAVDEELAVFGVDSDRLLMRAALVERSEHEPPQIVEWGPEIAVTRELSPWLEIVSAGLRMFGSASGSDIRSAI
jgi:hypothetical protein